jgi:Tol biopolymer transport system component
MQFHQFRLKSHYFLWIFVGLFFFTGSLKAQVNTVEFGKNRLQFKKFKWQYYQTPNFNTYFSQGGQELGKFVLQLAEKELPGIEKFVEYGLQRRANIVVYNTYNDMEQSNIGLNLDWQTTGGITKLVNNKMVVYYNGDHNNLRIQIRQGIARILVENILFGDDLGEFAANQALLDLPQWLTDGYIEYAGENWNTLLDDQLKSAMLSGRYKNFYQFAYERPNLAGHAFWYYLADKYKKENVTYFLYLSRVYRNLNNASLRICKKKFKEVLKDFMTEEEEKYEKDLRGRRNFPKGTVSVTEDINDHKDFFHFSPNPQPKSQTYAAVKYNRGKYTVTLYDNFINEKILLKNGVRSLQEQINPHYPLLAWDPKGTRLACIYWDRGKTRLFVYDVVRRYKPIVQDLPDFQQVQDFKYMLNDHTMIMSAVRNGQSDIYVYDTEKQTYRQITNDIYDDLDATFIAFPGKTGIIYSSNRPSAHASTRDTVLPSNYHYNIFLVDNWNDNEGKQVSQLTYLRYGNARYPMQYNSNHFTFVSDENGIANRYAGFFHTQRAGLDTVYKVGDELLHNPIPADLDSTLKAYNKPQADTSYVVSLSNDSAYIFPITNYQSSLVETKSAGDNGQVTEVRQEGDIKFLYKLKVDEAALAKRNVVARMTDYRKKTVAESQIAGANVLRPVQAPKPDSLRRQPSSDFFQSEFDRSRDTGVNRRPNNSNPFALRPAQAARQEVPMLQKAKLFDYNLKFSVDNFTAGFNNDVLISKYQPFTGSLPINLSGQDAFSGMLKASIFDLFEDIRLTGAIRLPFFGSGSSGSPIVNTNTQATFTPNNSSFFDGSSEYFLRVDYLKHLLDYSLVYYRETQTGNYLDPNLGSSLYPYDAKAYTNLWQGIIKYPFDKVRSLRFSVGYRMDKVIVRPDITGFPPLNVIDSVGLKAGPQNKQNYGLVHMEYVYDNTLLKATDIWNGLRYKVYMDWNTQLNGGAGVGEGRYTYNVGFDARHYLPIYRNFIWAVRAAGDYSWGNKKIVYYLGGTDGWLFPKANNSPQPTDPSYAFQSLAVNLRGYNQNLTNGSADIIINSELRLPIFTTLFNKPINNAFLRNFQLVQFFDLGTAWNGKLSNIKRPEQTYESQDYSGLTVLVKAGGIGPFAGGYGFGVRSTLLGYFLRFDAGWQMNTFFQNKPVLNVSMGVDF